MAVHVVISFPHLRYDPDLGSNFAFCVVSLSEFSTYT